MSHRDLFAGFVRLHVLQLARHGFPSLSHGLFATHPGVINPDLLALIRA
ncbi:hypothetical protein [Roseococcus suduntuyensis]|uniref:Uncharacterized protein n=1 Tax=Roseococcus suduntuyensis TaxID=455361 RepID=A0A840ACB7_9PROT|nr:hypothetical protein [Roseococcus suduntuyensis]MBB3898552.1 hypothetical protein [Roseococcus suduntuyensis]